MVDPSYFVAMLPEAADALDFKRANAIEDNVSHLIQSWPVFETELVRAFIGSLDYLQADEAASPAQGVTVSFIRVLPRLLVLLSGEGLEHITWSGEGWTEQETADGLTLSYTLGKPVEDIATAALSLLVFRSDGHADLTFTLAAERLDGSLRLPGQHVTHMLFRAEGTWGLLRARAKVWSNARALSWGGAGELRKE